MKTKCFITIIICFLSIMLNAQEYYYYYKGEKQYIALDRSRVNLTTSLKFREKTLDKSIIKEIKVNQDFITTNDMFGYIKFLSTPDKQEYERILLSLLKEEEIIAVHPNFITAAGIGIGMSSYFYVRLKESADYEILKELAMQNYVEIVEQHEYLTMWYTLRCTKETPDNTLNIANLFYETGLFASAVPDFLSDDVFCTNDPNFPDLWGLKNPDYTDIDVQACTAWEDTRGSGITVAVLDQGIELAHIDLSANISPLSYDTETGTSPSQVYGYHGTHCAGTVGAIRNNNIQVVGVSPECTLMSISNSLASTPNSRIKRADGINWAWHHGADIISNSWSSSVHYDEIDEAIDSALIYGRNGKGTVIVFATGNNYSSSISYPANANSSIIAVGAINIDGMRASFSNYGNGLDLVAPGVNILSTELSNTIGYLSGTSMACPHVAGVAALVLSKNPLLTQAQVQEIICKSGQKVGGYNYQNVAAYGTWNSEMGYGLVNACEALQLACSFPYYIERYFYVDEVISTCEDIYVKNSKVFSPANVRLFTNGRTVINGQFEVWNGARFVISHE